MATIRDVARTASVSISTVSRVVNGDSSVHPALRRLVLDAVEQTGYRPNAAARSLRLARTQTIAVVVPRLTNPVFTAIVDGAEAVARRRGMSVFLCDTRGSFTIQRSHLESVLEHRVDGVIIHPVGPFAEQLAPLTAAGIPVVVLGRRAPGSGYAEVVVEEQPASRAAFAHLLELGHRRIALVTHRFAAPAPGPVMAPQGRIAAYREAHARAGVPVDESLIAEALTPAEARERASGLLARPERPTALVVGTHDYLPECLLALREAGLCVPEDISVLAYGDSRWAEAYRPAISVVRIDYGAYGGRAAELLFAVAAGEVGERTLVQRSDLVLRESCAPPCRVRSGGREAAD